MWRLNIQHGKNEGKYSACCITQKSCRAMHWGFTFTLSTQCRWGNSSDPPDPDVSKSNQRKRKHLSQGPETSHHSVFYRVLCSMSSQAQVCRQICSCLPVPSADWSGCDAPHLYLMPLCNEAMNCWILQHFKQVWLQLHGRLTVPRI